MALDLEKLRAIARGEFPTNSENGVTDVTGVTVEFFGVTQNSNTTFRRNKIM
jgi:hypothetical protein